MKRKILILPFISFLFVLIIFFYLLVIERDPSEPPSVLIDKKVPTFETESLLNKKTFNSQNEFGSEITLVNFFATWCAPCRDEHVYIKSLSNNKGLKIIGPTNYEQLVEKEKRRLFTDSKMPLFFNQLKLINTQNEAT